MAMTLDNVTPRGRLGRAGMVMPLGRLGGLTPRGSELSSAGMVTPRGRLGKLGREPGIVLGEAGGTEKVRGEHEGKTSSSFFPAFL